jgi:hypothetical protein
MYEVSFFILESLLEHNVFQLQSRLVKLAFPARLYKLMTYFNSFTTMKTAKHSTSFENLKDNNEKKKAQKINFWIFHAFH